MKASRLFSLAVSITIFAAICAQAPAANQPLMMLKQITVTAQLRKQNLQRVPIAVTAIRGSEVRRRGIHDLNTLVNYVPGMTISPFALGQSLISLRGVSSNDDGPGTSSPVAVFIDGVYFGNVSDIDQTLFDISSIQVLRGPQGTLYGKNAIGGVINIHTMRPRMHGLHIRTEVTLGNYGRHNFSGLITGPLADGWAGKLVVSTRMSDGWVRNVALHTREKNDDSKAVRAQLLHVGAHTDWLLSANASKTNDEDMARVPMSHKTAFPLPLLQAYQSLCGTAPNPTCATNPYDGYQRQFSYGLSARFTYHLSPVTRFISITAWQRVYNQWSMDSLGAILPLGNDVWDDDRALTEQMRLVSRPVKRIHYVVGLWLSREYRNRLRLFLLPTLNPDPSLDEHYRGIDRIVSEAVFGQVDWRFAHRWVLSIGGRYSYEHRDMSNNSFGDAKNANGYGGAIGLGILPNSLINRVSHSWSRFTPKISLSYRPTSTVNLYLTEAEGFQSGGFAAEPTSIADTKPLRPEIAYNTEFGAKMEIMHRLRANLALYDTRYKDLQIQSFGPRPGIVNPPPNYIGEFETFNAGGARAEGVELEFDWLATEHLTIRGSYGYMHAKYSIAYLSNGSVYSLLSGPGNPACLVNPAQPGCVDLRNQSGLDMLHAPRNTGSLEAIYHLLLPGGGALEPSVSYTYTGRQRGELEPYAIQPAFGLLGARLTWMSSSDDYQVSLWGHNLTNKIWIPDVYTIANEVFGVYGTPRTYGLTFDWKFH